MLPPTQESLADIDAQLKEHPNRGLLSGSTHGKNILITATGSTSPTLIHTAVAGSVQMDEIWLYAMNTDPSNDVSIAILFGGTSSPADLIEAKIPHGEGLCLVIPGFVINNGVSVSAYATAGSIVSVNGFINRITPEPSV